MTIKISSLVISTSLLLLCSVSAAALADGMPFAEPPPQQNLTPIDKSLTPPPPAATAPQAEAPPLVVPEQRVVDVQPNTSFFGLSVGMFDPITHDSKSTAFNIEWQPGVKIMGTLQPLFGAMATTKGALMGYGGIGVPFNITDHVFMMPSVAVGAYRSGGDYDLGRTVVERVGTELAYQFDDKSRLGLNFDVLTNGMSLEARDRTEMVALTYTMPLNTFSGSSDPAPAQMQAPLVAPAAPAAPAPSAIAPPPAAAPTPAPAPSSPTAKPAPHELP